jgi:hypothetical protein
MVAEPNSIFPIINIRSISLTNCGSLCTNQRLILESHIL